MEDIKVSVIVPIYKVEQFIERCVVSLMEQTLDDVEYIFVDDASPDNSLQLLKEVIARYPDRQTSVTITKHTENRGLPSARNTGLAMAQGEYVFHCDGDDFMEFDMLESLYDEAIRHEAEIVWCDFFLAFEKNERYMKQPEFATPLEALKAMLGGAMKFNVWNKLAKRSLYIENEITFPTGNGMGEDMTMMMLFVHAKKVAYLPHAYYHYVKINTNAFSQTYSEKHLSELKSNVDRICQYILKYYGNELNDELAFLKLEVKFPFLISDDDQKHQLWKELYPESNQYIVKNKNISIRSRFLQQMANANQFWINSLYYKLVYKFIYGIIYK